MANLDLEALLSDDDEPNVSTEDLKAFLSNAPKALRDAWRKASKENKTLREELTALKSAGQKQTIADIVKAKGLPEKVASLYTGEPTAEAFDAWAADYADVFGVPAGAGDGAASTDASATPPGTPADHALRAAHERMSTAIAGATVQEPELAALQQVQQADSASAVMAALAAASGR